MSDHRCTCFGTGLHRTTDVGCPLHGTYGLNTNQKLLDYILKAVEERKNDSEFMGRLAESIKRNQSILDALARVDGPVDESGADDGGSVS